MYNATNGIYTGNVNTKYFYFNKSEKTYTTKPVYTTEGKLFGTYVTKTRFEAIVKHYLAKGYKEV